MTSCDQAAFFGMWSKSITRKGQKVLPLLKATGLSYCIGVLTFGILPGFFVTTDTENFTF